MKEDLTRQKSKTAAVLQACCSLRFHSFCVCVVLPDVVHKRKSMGSALLEFGNFAVS